MKTELFRMLCNGEQEWIGHAWNFEHAEEKCFRHEEPGSLCRYTLQKMVGKHWVTIYSDASLCMEF